MLADPPDAFVYEWDIGTGHVERSAALLTMLGYSTAEIGQSAEWWLDSIHPDDRPRVTERAAAAFADPTVTRSDDEYRVRHSDGGYRSLLDRSRLVRDEHHQVVRVVGVTTDVTAMREAGIDPRRSERLSLDADTLLNLIGSRAAAAAVGSRLHDSERRARFRSEQLQRLSGALSRTLSRAEVAEVTSRLLSEELGAYAGGVIELSDDGTEFSLLWAVGMGEKVRKDYAKFPVSSPLPVRDVAATHEAVFLRNVEEWRARFTDGPRTMAEGMTDGAWAALPLLVEDRLLGALTLSFPQPRDFSADDRVHLRAFADQCAQGLDRARAYEAESAARAQAERSARRLAALHTASTALAGALTPRRVAEAAMQTALPALGAGRGSLALVRGDGRAVELAGSTGYSEADLARYRVIPLDARFPLTDAVREQTAIFLPSADARRARYPELEALIRENGDGAMAAVPLWRAGRVIGVLGVNWNGRRDLDAEDQSFLSALAEQCAQAIERAELFDSERRARSRGEMILSSIQDGFIAFDHAFRFTYVNKRAEEMLQRPSAELLGRVATQLFPQYADSAFARVAREAFRARRVRMVEGFVAPEGTWTEARIYPTDEGVSVFFHDVTERRRTEVTNRIRATASAALADASGLTEIAEAIVHAALPEFGDWAILDEVGEDGVVRRLAMTGGDPAEVVRAVSLNERFPPDFWSPLCMPPQQATRVPRLVHEVRRAGLLAMLRGTQDAAAHADALLSFGISSALSVPLVARGRVMGGLTYLRCGEGRRFTDDDLPLARELASRAASAFAKARSLEAERVARAEAEAARREAEEANRAKMDFLTAMSHELRTPLNAIGGYAEILSLGLRGPVTDEQRQDLARIEGNQRHLLGLINDVLNFAKLDAGKVEYTLVTVELRAAMSAVEALVAPQLTAKSLRFRYGTCDDEVRVRADAEKTRQILLNILSNAVKYTPAGGEVEVTCASSDGRGVLRVRDSGMGIEAAKLEHIFEPFVQLGRTLTSRTEGTGLGLAISRDLARAMGGDLVAESEPGVGSTFTLTLPSA